MDSVNTGKISVDDKLKLKGLKDAWSIVLNSLDEEFLYSVGSREVKCF